MSEFEHQGPRIADMAHGTGPRTCVLICGLLLSQELAPSDSLLQGLLYAQGRTATREG